MHLLDEKSWGLLEALQKDGRLPLKTLAQKIGLSLPATAERIKRMEDAGVIRGVCAEISTFDVGYSVKAIIGIHAPQPGKQRLLETLEKIPEILECHHVTGADSYIMTVVAVDLKHLESLIGSINGFGETRTSIVFSTPIPRRGVARPKNQSLT
jgi:Lrp/AsnC family transcriptional regulator, leucine-responsive regulatory protein